MVYLEAKLQHGFRGARRSDTNAISTKYETYGYRSEILASGDSITGPRASLLLLQTDLPVQLDLVTPSGTKSLTVTSLFLSDEVITSFTVTHIDPQQDEVTVTVCWSGPSAS